MEQLAVPGTIRMSEDTYHLAEGFIDAKPLGPTEVKGLSDPIRLYELTAARPSRRGRNCFRIQYHSSL